VWFSSHDSRRWCRLACTKFRRLARTLFERFLPSVLRCRRLVLDALDVARGIAGEFWRKSPSHAARQVEGRSQNETALEGLRHASLRTGLQGAEYFARKGGSGSPCVRLMEMSDSLSERNFSFLLSRTLANHMLITCCSHTHHILALRCP
jgi:hypothetical protein